MKKWMLLSVVIGVLPLSMTAQDDDMYLVPGKKKTTPKSAQVTTYTPAPDTYYSGSRRSVDEYNRRGSSYEVLPADTGDVISFDPVAGVYPDSVSDFKLTRHMERWEGYEPSQAYWDGYNQGRSDSWLSWHSPWYYSSYYPWYDSWYYDPWYYHSSWSWRYGWYDPWYYSWGYSPYYSYGWYGGWGWGGYYSYYPQHRWYGGGGGHYSYRNGTIDRYGRSHGSFSGYRGGGTASSGSASRFGRASSRGVNGHSIGGGSTTRSSVGVRQSRDSYNSRSASSTYSGSSSSSGNFSGSRSSGGSYSGSSRSSGGSYSGGSSSGSFGGSRSSGGGGGASSRSSGGGGGRSGSSRR